MRIGLYELGRELVWGEGEFGVRWWVRRVGLFSSVGIGGRWRFVESFER